MSGISRNVSASSGNLSQLLGALLTASDVYTLHVQSYSTTGTGTSERIASITAVVGSSGIEGGVSVPPNSPLTVSAFDNTQNTVILTSGIGINADAFGFAPSYVLGYSATALLFSSMPSFNIALGLDDKISQDVSLEIMSVEPLASGAVITFPASGSTYDDALTIVCYRAGTRIATPNGERPIEDLLEGDFVEARLAGHAPVRWIGRREVDCRRHPKPHDAWPVRVLAGAFGADLPRRDLWLSPDHSVFVDSVLVPIRYLLNDASIRQVPMDEVTYYHIELPRHDVVLAENLPAESYLDSGNRGAFANGGPSAHLHPDFALRVWKAEGCAPLVLGGPRLAAVKRRLLARAASLGFRSTNDPDIKVVADGRVLRLEAHGALRYARLPDQASNVRLTSRVWVPANMRPDEADTRALGVAISRLWLDGREASLDSPALDAGWHAPEPGWRWTDGDATLAPAGAREIVFEVAMAGPYWRADRSDQRDAA